MCVCVSVCVCVCVGRWVARLVSSWDQFVRLNPPPRGRRFEPQGGYQTISSSEATSKYTDKFLGKPRRED